MPAAPQSKSGLIEFMDPRVLAGPVPSQAFHPPVLLQPKAGMMLIFPGWLMHFVHPYQGSGQRISIAFNLRVKSYDLNDLGSTAKGCMSTWSNGLGSWVVMLQLELEKRLL